MAQFDTTLKLLLQRPASTLLREITGLSVTRWLNVELPRVQNPRVDLLGETADGSLIHFEFQKGNDRTMEYRMAEYYLAIYRLLARHPTQIVIYVGSESMQMKERLETPVMSYNYQLINIRTLNGQALLESPEVQDNILAILTDLQDRHGAVRRILATIEQGEPSERATLLGQFMVIAGLRQLEGIVLEELNKMAISTEELIRENTVLGPAFAKERQEGRQEGELRVLRRLIEKRFGALPEWASARLDKSSPAELEELALRVLDARNLEELLS